ncbi:kinase-like domain-containing protein [Podospora didyma]|uniref:Kinase-like domain-containing protein n=1 Tax=Podospora didyma TaxID=330526 RepID=A0AAE0N0N9_9PEZI|nr:kinase-like domain-containing protein [Podospora didyma]
MSDEINFPSGFTIKDLVAYGNTGLVLLDTSTGTVVKASHDGERSAAMAVEQQIYERFVQRGGHKGILIYHGTFESGIRLEYASHGNIRSYLENHPADELRRIRWAVQVAQALDFAHQCGVIHGDINGFNVLLDRHLDAKLADFAGSSLDGSPLLIGVTASHEYPGPLLCTEADIFALGSTLYELMNGSRPQAGLSDTAIEQRYKRGEFAETESLGNVGSIITKCWQGEYKECRQVVHDLEAARQSALTSSSHSTRPAKSTSAYTILAVATVVVVVVSALVKLRLSRAHQAS